MRWPPFVPKSACRTRRKWSYFLQGSLQDSPSCLGLSSSAGVLLPDVSRCWCFQYIRDIHQVSVVVALIQTYPDLSAIVGSTCSTYFHAQPTSGSRSDHLRQTLSAKDLRRTMETNFLGSALTSWHTVRVVWDDSRRHFRHHPEATSGRIVQFKQYSRKIVRCVVCPAAVAWNAAAAWCTCLHLVDDGWPSGMWKSKV